MSLRCNVSVSFVALKRPARSRYFPRAAWILRQPYRSCVGACKIAVSPYRIRAMLKYILIGIVALTGWLSYERYHAPKPVVAPVAAEPAVRVITPPSMFGHPPGSRESVPAPPTSPANAAPKFVCDGRVHCSQMRSCEEATFFLRSCPGTKMDGDGDGIPCEEQHCGHGGLQLKRP